jgi:hypothetical protein
MTTTTWVALGLLVVFVVLYLGRRKARLKREEGD